MEIDLKNKVAIVTGAGRGIGREVARSFAAEGARVIVTDIRGDLLREVTAEWEDKGWAGGQLHCDVRKGADCRAVAAEVEKAFGRIDILVNNAGVARGGRVAELDEEVWVDSLDVNLSGTMRMCQAVIPAMQRQGCGRILNAASFAAIIPSIGGAAYAAGKAGVASFTRVLASELGPYGITVNCYAPGMVPTEMNHFAERERAEQERLLDTLSIRRWEEPQDVANLLCFLASDLAGYITGAMIDVSGGKFATQMPWVAHRKP
jgi:3-oxoacyl-[acyl-carrier protein] reductase